ncbi:MAG: hypothetical protein K2L82_16685 [Lachnospiraceae bacterium]|nr:hypothetical protein [Lachnospiraceae bacterium]
MKKTVTAVCVFLCTTFLCACTIGQDKTTDLDNAEEERPGRVVIVSEETAVPDDGQTDYVQQETNLDDGRTADVQDGGTDKDGQDTLTAVQMRGLMQGELGGIGSGFLAYVPPQQDGEDYKLCFFKESNKATDFEKSISEAVYYPLETADYIFPDVRDNNASIGKFNEIYFFDTVTMGEGATGLAVIATYDANGGTCYDTRIYRWDGTDYIAEGKLIQEFNEKYCNEEEYPVDKLYHLSLGTVDDSYYSVATDIPSSDVESYAARVKQLFLQHDWSAISAEISYPITISDITYNNGAEFLDASNSFDSNLEAAFFSALEKEDCKEMFCNWEGIMLGEGGQIWISEVLDAEFTSQGLKITAVNGLLTK